ncbi:hypothetical protein A3731_15945 [Roseovarius sp. HI0049]|nr:hypothetical protein A3731_15945 [Roseovarius sp. HI0049]
MYQENAGRLPQGVDQCRYDGSRLLFRGPRRRLEGDFVACLGGTETYGKFIANPYPDLLEGMTGLPCVNFGWPNAGVDVFAKDRALLDCARRARLCVLQVPGALNMSNKYYRVHPRRNDRFLQATDALRELFPEVDFTEFSFTRHMMRHLHSLSADRFGHLRRALETRWVAGMTDMLQRVEAPVALLWLSARAPEATGAAGLWDDPALVTRDMLEALRGQVHAIVEPGLSAADRGIDPAPLQSPQVRRIAQEMLSPRAHERAAEALRPVLAGVIAN